MNRLLSIVCSIGLLAIVGCGDNSSTTTTVSSATPTQTTTERPTFVLGYSEYPSSSVYGVAADKGWINGEKNKVGPLEEKWGIDIVLKQVDYDTLIAMYGNGQADAVCIVAFDTLAASVDRPAVNIIPVSTSAGGDAVVVSGVNSIADLKNKTTYGLEKSVSQYLFERVLSNQNLNPAEYQYKNMDPAAAATAIQTK